MKFRTTELLYRWIWIGYDYRVDLRHVLFVLQQIYLINCNLHKKIYLKQLKSFSLCPNSTHRTKIIVQPKQKLSQEIYYCNQTILLGYTKGFLQILNNFEFYSLEICNVLAFICVVFACPVVEASDSVFDCLLIKGVIHPKSTVIIRGKGFN